MFAPYLEVIIHDLQTPEHSIIAIFNNHVTGRKIGDGTSDIGYKKLADKLPDKIVNYNNKSPSGTDLKSSSLTIRNRKDVIIGSMGFNFDLSSTHNSFVYLIEGEIKIGDKNHDKVNGSTLIILTKGKKLKVKGITKSKFLLISGKPIGEPIARGGPFVMNTKEEILKAVQDYHSGNFVQK